MNVKDLSHGSPATVAATGPCGPDDLTERLENLQEGAQVVVAFLEIAGASEPGTAHELADTIRVPCILAVRGDGSVPQVLVDAFDLCFVSPGVSIRSGQTDISASDAAGLGLINQVIRKEAVFQKASEAASSISQLAPKALEACKRAVREGAGLELEEGLRLEIGLFSEIFATRDMKEGTGAFLEKRAPVFRGE